MKFIWYNPDSKAYEIGSGNEYKQQRVISNNPEGFTLLYKMNTTTSRIGQKLISELNKARTEQRPGVYPVHAA